TPRVASRSPRRRDGSRMSSSRCSARGLPRESNSNIIQAPQATPPKMAILTNSSVLTMAASVKNMFQPNYLHARKAKREVLYRLPPNAQSEIRNPQSLDSNRHNLPNQNRAQKL